MTRVVLQYALLLLAALPALIRAQGEQALVELALRQQLSIYAARRPRPRLRSVDRAFWVFLSQCWPRWRSALRLVQPETVIRWHRQGFRLYWRWLSNRGPGRPRISPELRSLIRRLALENGWGARKVHAELGKLGFTVSLATVARYLHRKKPDPRRQQGWATFLRNHQPSIAAMDFFVVPTARFKLLYVWFAIGHGRRRILHFNVTSHPTAAWTMHQLREAFSDASSVRFLIHDNDAIFSERLIRAVARLGVKSKPTVYRSPWQNGIAERWVGTVRRELLDHVIVVNERQLRRLLRDYVAYYNEERVHTRLRDSPTGRAVQAKPSGSSRLVALPRVGGLHHRYVWREAA